MSDSKDTILVLVFQKRPAGKSSNILIEEKKGELVRLPGKEYWRRPGFALPGGGIKLGETNAHAGKREIEEETGIKIETEEGLEVYLPKSGHRHIGIVGYFSGGELAPNIREGILECDWFPLSVLNRLNMYSSHRKIANMLLEKLGLTPFLEFNMLKESTLSNTRRVG